MRQNACLKWSDLSCQKLKRDLARLAQLVDSEKLNFTITKI